ncbi:MAG: hypothetical protein JSW01_01960 [Candidatus Bathyarchaeota archaeon]|nr:MAG: hypothetical protein JSW01_01960 [Candidatus Bathyarchaeota archaeon]
MDEQECIKADVALSCFLRALLRGLLEDPELNPPHTSLIQDFKTIVKYGMNAETRHPQGSTAQDVCRHLYRVAEINADEEEKRYLWIVKKRIEEGPLSYLITRDVERRRQETSLEEAIFKVYSNLAEKLQKNQIYT